MANKKHFLVLIAICCLLANCESISDPEIDEEYPVFIPTLERQTLEELNSRYHQENDNLICSTLNEYGFTGFSRVLFPNDENPCLSRDEVKIELQYSDEILQLAKNTVAKNAEYTGVTDPTSLKIKEMISLDGCTICEGQDINNVPLQWKFTFENQFVNGVPVENTSVVVYVDANGVNRIWGNWYPDIEDPGFVDVGSNAAKESVIGLKVRYANEQNQIFEQEIKSEHVIDEVELEYNLIEKEGGAEIHKTWKISVLQEDTSEIRWFVYISTVTGEILKTELIT